MTSAMSRRALLRAAGGLALAACAGELAGASPSPARSAAASPGSATATRPSSPLAANAALGVWPDRIRTASADIREAYEYATRGPRSLRYIPCYCGCGGVGHDNNLDCYVKTFASDGWVVLDLHGYG